MSKQSHTPEVEEANKLTQYPLYNKRGELIGTCELDNVVTDYDGKEFIYCFDGEGNEYQQDAWGISRILNFSDPKMPSMYGKEN